MNDAPTRARLYRTAGVGALVAGIAFILQFPYWALLPSDGSTVEELAAGRWVASYGVITYLAIGAGTLYLVMATHRLVADAGTPTVSATISSAFGTLMAIGWFGGAGGVMQRFGLGLDNLKAGTDDPDLQQIVILSQDFEANVLWLVIIGATGWLIGLATAGRRAGVIGRPLTVVASVAALLIGAPAVALLLPFGVVLLIPIFLTLGVAFLLKARELSLRPAEAPAIIR